MLLEPSWIEPIPYEPRTASWSYSCRAAESSTEPSQTEPSQSGPGWAVPSGAGAGQGGGAGLARAAGPARPGPAVISMLRAVVRRSRLCPALLRAPFSAAAASPIPAPNPRPDIAYNKVGPRWEPGAAGLGRGIRGSRARRSSLERGWARPG